MKSFLDKLNIKYPILLYKPLKEINPNLHYDSYDDYIHNNPRREKIIKRINNLYCYENNLKKFKEIHNKYLTLHIESNQSNYNFNNRIKNIRVKEIFYYIDFYGQDMDYNKFLNRAKEFYLPKVIEKLTIYIGYKKYEFIK